MQEAARAEAEKRQRELEERARQEAEAARKRAEEEAKKRVRGLFGRCRASPGKNHHPALP